MKMILTVALLISGCYLSANSIQDLPTKDIQTYQADSQWAIVGAGPAGITIVGLLLDLGINPDNIYWIDPEFNVGRLGKFYGNVPANVTNNSFIKFMESCKTFMSCESQALDDLFNKYDRDVEHTLQVVIDPLQDITDFLKTKVNTITDVLTSLHFKDDVWHIATKQKTFTASHVVLATGSHPRTLDYKECTNQIPLDLALNKCNLCQLVEPMDSVAVVGSSHSAILLVKFLSELNVMRIINFYKHPLVYDRAEVGLLGETAEFAKNVLEKNPPANLLRIYNTPESRKAWLPICNKIIYAVGYTQNPVPIEGHLLDEITYDDATGVVGPRLFGIGIAFPETFYDAETCSQINKVGLVGFMEYAQRILPDWVATKEPINRFTKFEDLFFVDLL